MIVEQRHDRSIRTKCRRCIYKYSSFSILSLALVIQVTLSMEIYVGNVIKGSLSETVYYHTEIVAFFLLVPLHGRKIPNTRIRKLESYIIIICIFVNLSNIQNFPEKNQTGRFELKLDSTYIFLRSNFLRNRHIERSLAYVLFFIFLSLFFYLDPYRLQNSHTHTHTHTRETLKHSSIFCIVSRRSLIHNHPSETKQKFRSFCFTSIV